jgi:hypothetical protein
LLEVFLPKLPQISQGNCVLDLPDSNTDGLFSEDTCVFELSGTCLFGTNRAYPHFEKPKLEEFFLSTTMSILTGKQWARCSCF